jgi:hypothetical protein
LRFYPRRSGFLYFFQEVCLADGACQSGSDVDVVGNTSDAVSFASAIATNGGKIGVHPRPDRGIKPGVAVFCAKDYMDDNLTERLWHAATI